MRTSRGAGDQAGIALTADIVYDIPVGERIARLKSHSSPDTRGVVINVH